MLHHCLNSSNITSVTEKTVRHLKSIKIYLLLHCFRLIHKEITLSRHDAAVQAQHQPLHSLTNGALNVWQ